MQTFTDMIKNFDIKFLEQLRNKFLPMDREILLENAEGEALLTKKPLQPIIDRKERDLKRMETDVNNQLKIKYEIRTAEEASKGAKGTGVPPLIKSNGKWRVAK